MWDIHPRLNETHMPDHRVVVQVDLTGANLKNSWLILEHPMASVGGTNPGIEVAQLIRANSLALHRVRDGLFALDAALRQLPSELDGPVVRSRPGSS